MSDAEDDIVIGSPPAAGPTLWNWWNRLLSRIGHLWVENPWQLLKFTWELLVACVRGRSEAHLQPGSRFAFLVWKQTWRTLIRTAVLTVIFGLVMGIAIGNVVAGIGGLVRLFIDGLTLGIIFKQIFPLIIALLLLARVGVAIAGKFSTAPLIGTKPGETTRRFLSPNRDLLGRVVPHIIAATITGAAMYVILTICVIGGYQSDGVIGRVASFPAGTYADFISTRQLWDEVIGGLVRASVFGLLIALVASALGIDAGNRVAMGSVDPDDYYYAAWESGATSLLLCAAIIGLTW